VAGPANTEFCAALDKVNVNAGVVVAVATEVVNSGERAPAEKDVTDPLPVPHVGQAMTPAVLIVIGKVALKPAVPTPLIGS
jgi:hypothetical protein